MLPLITLMSILFIQDYFKNRIFIRSVFFYLVIFLNFLFGSQIYDSIIEVICAICLYIAVSALAFFYSKSNDVVHHKMIFFSTIFFIVFTTVASYFINESFPNIIRYSGSGDQDGDYRILVTSLQRFGLSSFDIVHALPILIPSLILGFKTQSLASWKRYSFLIIALVCVFQTYVSGSATPLFLSILVLLSSIVLHVGSFRSNIIVFTIFVIVCVIILSPEVLSSILSSFSSILGTDSGELQARIADVDEAVSTGNADSGDMGLRMNHYQISLNAFYSNVLFGSRDIPLGGHSFILDTLGGYGLVGFIALSSFVVAMLKYIIKRISSNLTPFYVLSIIAAVVMLATKNTGTWATWCFLFIISPVFIKYIDSISNTKA